LVLLGKTARYYRLAAVNRQMRTPFGPLASGCPIPLAPRSNPHFCHPAKPGPRPQRGRGG